MAVAHDTSTRFPAGAATVLDTTTGDRTFSHAANANAKGAVVIIGVDEDADPVTGVLYGGTAMSPVATCSDTSEPGRIVIYFLGNLTGLGGTQTVTLQGCTATGKYADCSTVTASTSTTALDNTGVVNTQTSTNPTVSFTTVANAMVYGAVVGGAAAPTSYAAGTGETASQDGDFGANSSRTARSTAATSAGSYTFNYSYGTSDDWAVAAISVKEVADPTTTSVARLSLASGGTPSTRTDHSIRIRGRVTTTASATFRAALYEGANNRSGDLESSALTTSLADYTLAIPDANAANITDYSNLELRIWGYSAASATPTVEVAEIWLQTPAAPTVVTGRASVAATATVTAVGARTTRVFTASAALAATTTVTAQGRDVTKTAAASVAATSAVTTQGRITKVGQVSIAATTAVASDGAKVAAGYSDVILAEPGLVGYWRLDDTSGTTAVATVGTNGTYVNTPALGQPGLVGDGTSVETVGSQAEDITLPYTPLTDTGTVEVWFRWWTAQTVVRDHSGGGGWIIGFDNSGTFAVRVNGTTTINTSKTTAQVRDGRRHHLVVVRKTVSPTVVVYLDAVQIGTSTATTATTSISPWHLGRNGTNAFPFYSDAQYDEFAVYSSTLDATAVSNHYTAGGAAPGGLLKAGVAVTAASGVASDGAKVTAGPQTYTASAAITAASAVTAVPQRTLQRVDQLAATGTVTASGSRVARTVSASAAITAASAVTVTSRRTLQRTTASSAVSAITVTGLRAHPRQATLSATTAIQVTARRNLLRATAITATGAVTASGTVVPHGVVERGAAITATTAVTAAQRRTIVRSASATATGTVTVGSKLVAARRTAISATGTVTAAGVVQAAGVVERGASVTATGAVTVTAVRRNLLRSAALTSTASVTAAGEVQPHGVVSRGAAVTATSAVTLVAYRRTHARSVAVTPTSSITAAGVIQPHGLVERSAAITATSTVTLGAYRRTHARSSTTTAAVVVASIGQRTLARRGAITATMTITAGGVRLGPPPALETVPPLGGVFDETITGGRVRELVRGGVVL